MSDYELETPVDEAPAEAPVEEAPEYEAADEWAPPASREEFEAYVQAEREAAAQQAYYEALSATQLPTEPQTFDPANVEEPEADYLEYDPELVAAIDKRAEAIAEAKLEAFAEYQPILDLVAEQQGAQLAEQYLSNIEGQIGVFDHGHAHLIATGLVEQGQEPAQALYNAALIQRQQEQAIQQRAFQAYQDTLQNRESASAQPGVAGAATEITELGDYDDIANRYLASIGRPTHAAG